jgi:hypothetical protein
MDSNCPLFVSFIPLLVRIDHQVVVEALGDEAEVVVDLLVVAVVAGGVATNEQAKATQAYKS